MVHPWVGVSSTARSRCSLSRLVRPSLDPQAHLRSPWRRVCLRGPHPQRLTPASRHQSHLFTAPCLEHLRPFPLPPLIPLQAQAIHCQRRCSSRPATPLRTGGRTLYRQPTTGWTRSGWCGLPTCPPRSACSPRVRDWMRGRLPVNSPTCSRAITLHPTTSAVPLRFYMGVFIMLSTPGFDA